MTRILAALAVVVALLGVPSMARADEAVTCADFVNQASAEMWQNTHDWGPGNPLDINGNGIACEDQLPCPCDYTLAPGAPVTVTPPATPSRSEITLAVTRLHLKPGETTWFTVTRYLDLGDGRLIEATGKVMLQEKERGDWRTIPGSRAEARRIRYPVTIDPGTLKIRARTTGPESYSKVWTLIGGRG